MVRTQRRIIFVVAALLVAVILVVAWVANTTFAQDPHHWGLSGRNLTQLSPQQVAQVALDYTNASGYVQNGTPQILLARSIQNAELPQLDRDSVPVSTIEAPPLVLVILKGDFVVNTPRGIASDGPRPAQYIGYVYDLWAGEPTLMITAPHGGIFRKALHDPSLPDDNPAAPPQAHLGTPTLGNGALTHTAPTLHYGAVAPTAVAWATPATK